MAISGTMSEILQLFTSFKQILPDVIEWINQYIDQHSDKSRAVNDFDFKRLGEYFSKELLARSKVVFVDRVVLPPLSQMGLPFFAAFEQTPYSGITYKDTFFLAPDAHYRESTWFHEMVHVVQWEELTPEPFLIAYAAGLLTDGYRNSPLEAMAYNFQDMFDHKQSVADIELLIRRKTRDIEEIVGRLIINY